VFANFDDYWKLMGEISHDKTTFTIRNEEKVRLEKLIKWREDRIIKFKYIPIVIALAIYVGLSIKWPHIFFILVPIFQSGDCWNYFKQG
jgi:hypothetical protein